MIVVRIIPSEGIPVSERKVVVATRIEVQVGNRFDSWKEMIVEAATTESIRQSTERPQRVRVMIKSAVIGPIWITKRRIIRGAVDVSLAIFRRRDLLGIRLTFGWILGFCGSPVSVVVRVKWLVIGTIGSEPGTIEIRWTKRLWTTCPINTVVRVSWTEGIVERTRIEARKAVIVVTVIVRSVMETWTIVVPP